MSIFTQPNFALEISQAQDVIDRLVAEREDLELAVVLGDADAAKKLRALEADLQAATDRRDKYTRAKQAFDRQEAETFAKNKKKFRQSQFNVCKKHLDAIGPSAKEFEVAAAALDTAWRKLNEHCELAQRSCPADAGEIIEFASMSANNIRRLASGQLWRMVSPPGIGGSTNADQMNLPEATPAALERQDDPAGGVPISEELGATAAMVQSVLKARLDRLK